MLRRTASFNRNNEREDDETLIRHIHDAYHIQKSNPSDIDELKTLVGKIIAIDVERYGNQHAEFVASPADELSYGLHLLASDPIHKKRYTHYLSPMVYADDPVNWEDAFNVFKILVDGILDF